MAEFLPDPDFAFEEFARCSACKDFDGYCSPAPSAFIYRGEVADPDFTDLLIEVNFIPIVKVVSSCS